MKVLSKIMHNGVKLVPVFIVLLLLPFLLAFDSVLYWIGRPSCLNCGSLSSFLQNSSLSVHVVGSMVGSLGIGGYTFGKKKHG